MPTTPAYWASWVLAWREHDVDDALSLLWKRVAYATRYGRASLTEAMTRLDQHALDGFLRAVMAIVADENKSSSPSTFQNGT